MATQLGVGDIQSAYGEGTLPLNLSSSVQDDAGLYVVETVQRAPIGQRKLSRDGRVYRYSLSVGACYTGQLAAFTEDKAIATTSAAAVASGSRLITFATQTFAKDALKGGYITIFGNPGSVADNARCPFRRIVGNTVCSGSTVIIEMDGPMTFDVATAQFCEVYYNPYRALSTAGGTNGTSFAGVAAEYVSASGYYFYCQTWGPCWIAPQVASFETGGLHRDCYARHDGSIQDLGNSDAYDTNKQRVGFIIQANLTAGPLVMLQIDR